MKKYTVVLTCSDGPMLIDVIGDFSFKANNQTEAMNKANTLEVKVSSSFNCIYYDKYKKDIIFDILPNELGISKGSVIKCIWYDESKGEWLNETFKDGKTIFPIANPICDTIVDINEFMSIIDREYVSYLKHHDILTFESIAFGVMEVN